MAEILTDPATGQRRNVEVRYDEPGGMGDINPQAIQRLFETQKMEDAEKALSAAIQFQGLRGYQQALKSGEAAEKAMTRFGPMMFYQRPTAVGSAIRSVTPPTMTPYQQATIDVRKQRASQPQIRSIPGGGFVSINPTNQAITTVRQPTLQPPRPTPLSLENKAEAEMAAKTFKEATAELESAPVIQPAPGGFLRRATPGNLDEIKSLEKKRDDARTKLQSFSKDVFDSAEKRLDLSTAAELLKKAGGDKGKARQLAKELGYSF